MSKNHQHYRGAKPAKSLDELGEMLKTSGSEPAKESGRIEEEFIPAKKITRVSFNGEVVYTSDRPDFYFKPVPASAIELLAKQAQALADRAYDKLDPYGSFVDHAPQTTLPNGEDAVSLLALQHMRDKGCQLTFARISTPWGAVATVTSDIVNSLKTGEVVWSYLNDGISTITVAKSKSVAEPSYFIALKVYKPGSMSYKVWPYGDLIAIDEMNQEAGDMRDSLPDPEPGLIQRFLG